MVEPAIVFEIPNIQYKCNSKRGTKKVCRLKKIFCIQHKQIFWDLEVQVVIQYIQGKTEEAYNVRR